MNFKDVWKVLRRVGWSYKPSSSRSLDLRYRYVRPGGNPNGINGQDYFLGEEALVGYFNSAYADEAPYVKTGNSVGVLHSANVGTKSSAIDELDALQVGATAGNVASIPEQGDISLDTCDKDDDRRTRQLDGNPVAHTIPKATIGVVDEQICVHTSTVDEPQQSRTKSTVSTPICPVCESPCSTQRSCTTCGAFMHHFCSHDVCAALELYDPDGQQILDFGDASFCSKQCYREKAAPVVMNMSGQNQGGTTGLVSGVTTSSVATSHSDIHLQGQSQSEGVLIRTSEAKSNPPPLLPVKRKPKSATRKTDQPRTATEENAKSRVSSTRKNSKSAERSQSKGKQKISNANATAFRKELAIRAEATANRYVGASVAFSPAEETWMERKYYSDVGSTYLIGVVTRHILENKKNGDGVAVPTLSFEVRWTNTAFQTKHHVHQIEEDVVCRGVKHYVAIHQNSAEFGESWSALCSMVPKYTNIPQLTDEFDEVQESEYREWSVFRSQKELQIDLCPAEVELIQGMTFSPTASLDEVPGLFAHPDGSTTTKLREESKHLFGKSASSSFFAFIPISFWKQVVTFSNGRAAETSGQLGAPIELEELMIFLGIQWYMTLVDKGEMRNYWFDNEDSNIFPGQSSTSLATVMSWKRYLYIRKNLSFRPRTSAEELSSDPAASIRPLITILKI